MTTTFDREEKHSIETLIDRRGIVFVLNVIEEICRDKAEHLRSDWQSPREAKSWETLAGRIGKVRVPDQCTFDSL